MEATDIQEPKPKKQKTFDHTKHGSQHIAFKIAYIGWRYKGFASQAHTEETVEEELFKALKKTCLIGEREGACYSRCGRTDRGVSAFGNVIALHVRSTATQGVGLVRPGAGGEPLNYARILNGVLPPDIRVVGWCPVPLDFSARFSTVSRTYKYFFLHGGLNIEAMQEAANAFVGVHDFRNFCKVDADVTVFVRKIMSIEISQVSESVSVMTIVGNSFLWHQIRMMMGVLLVVGSGEEAPGVVAGLLDVVAQPRRPAYAMASELPLVLYDCHHGLTYTTPPPVLAEMYKVFFTAWQELTLKQALYSSLIGALLGDQPAPPISAPPYIPLDRLPKTATVEEQQHRVQRRRANAEAASKADNDEGGD